MLDVACYETPAAAHRLIGLSCTGFGCSARETWVCTQRTLGCYGAIFVPKGSGWLETAATSGRLQITAGTLFWVFPKVAHSYAPDPEGWAEQWVMFEGPLAETFEQLGFLSPARPTVHVGAAGEIASLFAELRVDFASGSPLASVLGAALVHRLVIVAHRIGHEVGGENGPLAAQVLRARARLDELASEPLDFAEIARECQMGYSTFRRRFKQATGYSPKEYVLRVRLGKAKHLLAFTDRSVADVAEAVGFTDPYYFSRLFHAKEGVSPTLFREQQGVLMERDGR